ncbi:MAG: hypothetical protein HY725_21995 [Candidatus Rokubacteria bacterium]|nr:hypothetical protein [Candidatus Rokubacteria bacterium]
MRHRICRSRWVAVACGSCAGVALLLTLWAPGVVAQTKVRVTVGVIPTSQGNGPQHFHMKKQGLFEKYAREFGYELEVKQLIFQTGPQVTEGMAKGDIDFGIAGYLPLATIIASDLPILPISNVEGAAHWILVRRGSPIKDLDDLVKHKAKIATAVGSTSHYVLLEMFRVHYGKSPEEMGVTVLHMPPSEGITFPQGIDAILYWEALPSLAEMKVGAVRLLDEYGRTGSAHRLGAGVNLAERSPEIWKKSPYWPESLVAYRVYLTVRKAFVERYPKLFVAFLLAHQEAVHTLSKDYRLAHELNKEYWPLPFDKVEAFLKVNYILGRRDWVWLTESDFKPVVWGSYWAHAKGLIRRQVTWDMVQEYLRPIAALTKEAYDKAGGYPSLAVMTREAQVGDKPVPDIRGYPIWMMDRWEKRLPAEVYKYGGK